MAKFIDETGGAGQAPIQTEILEIEPASARRMPAADAATGSSEPNSGA